MISSEKYCLHHLKCLHSTHRDCIITSNIGISPSAEWWGLSWWWSHHPDLCMENWIHLQRSKPSLMSILYLTASYWNPTVSKNHRLLWISPRNRYNFVTIICLTLSPLILLCSVGLSHLPGNLSSPIPPLCDPKRPLKCQREECDMKRADTPASTTSWVPVAWATVDMPVAWAKILSSSSVPLVPQTRSFCVHGEWQVEMSALGHVTTAWDTMRSPTPSETRGITASR